MTATVLVAADVIEAVLLGLAGAYAFDQLERRRGGEPPNGVHVGIIVTLACFFVMATIDTAVLALRG